MAFNLQTVNHRRLYIPSECGIKGPFLFRSSQTQHVFCSSRYQEPINDIKYVHARSRSPDQSPGFRH
jgi:hypothetical protein